MVYDNGKGMPPNVLQVATSFGGSMTYGSRSGIGRFGMGMKTAALSMSPVVEIYSWQEPKAVYRMILDTNEIGRDKANLVSLPKPDFLAEFGDDIVGFFIHPMSFPKDRNEQDLVTPEGVEVTEALGRSGTIVYMPECDRLTYAKARTLVEHAVKEMARIYRREIAKGLKLYINNRRVRAIDPTFSMQNAWHDKIEGLKVKTSRLVHAKKVKIAKNQNSSETVDITVKLFSLPIEEWSSLPRKTLKNDMGVFSGHNISILRNDREVFAGYLSDIVQRHGDTNWFRIEIDFPGELDEAFGIAANKQGVRPKGYVIEAINAEIGDDITAIREEIKRFQSKRATESRGSVPSQSEARANESDAFQPEPLDLELTDEQETQIEGNLKGLAIALKRETEKAISYGGAAKLVDVVIRKGDKRQNIENGALVGSSVMDLTEYGRIVHAEMCAICDAARVGRSVNGATLYCTTFPCHNCVRYQKSCLYGTISKEQSERFASERSGDRKGISRQGCIRPFHRNFSAPISRHLPKVEAKKRRWHCAPMVCG
jgi:hypothetical protein